MAGCVVLAISMGVAYMQRCDGGNMRTENVYQSIDSETLMGLYISGVI
ncbi:MAG: hypothetical protein VX737_04005 [Pseudomonadota bacterium]|nr:hypothetical protein [Pseudomonadota bacterium]